MHFSAGTVRHERLLCPAPCNSQVPVGPDVRYVLTGRDIPASDPFDFGPGHGDVTLKVAPGSGFLNGLGTASLTIGGLAVLLGGSWIGTSALLSSMGQRVEGRDPWPPTALELGIVAGGAALVGTAFLLWNAAKTRVAVKRGPARPPPEAANEVRI